MTPTVPAKYRDHWQRPWTRKAKYSLGFRRWLHSRNRLSPHFTYGDAKCKDGTHIPRHLRWRARNHAFNLERFRHEIGDVPLSPLSWYRTKAHNVKVGGAKKSQHVRAVATDFTAGTVERVGRGRWDAAAEKVFKRGGIGKYPSGSAHLDSRGYRARW